MTTITEDYVSFETAKLLKDKGFDEACWSWYHNGNNTHTGVSRYCNSELEKYCFSKATLAHVMKWLREVHNIIIEPEPVWNGKKWEYQLFIVTPQNADSPYYEHNPYKSYEECVEVAIKYCLENLI